MVYSVGGKRLNCIGKVLENETNDVWSAQDISETGNQEFYTLLIIKRHETAKLFMDIKEQGRLEGRDFGAEVFACRDEFGVVYPCRKERPLWRFYNGGACSGRECTQICLNLVAECVSCGEAWPLLYLILEQNQVHLMQDNSVSLGCCPDLSGLDGKTGERDCAMRCAAMALEIMGRNKEMEKTIGMKLIQKKLLKEGYSCFTELFRDIHMDAGAREKVKLKERAADFFRTRKREMIRLALAVSVILGILALFMILSQMLFGDIPFLRIFTNSFETIGRESLLN